MPASERIVRVLGPTGHQPGTDIHHPGGEHQQLARCGVCVCEQLSAFVWGVCCRDVLRVQAIQLHESQLPGMLELHTQEPGSGGGLTFFCVFLRLHTGRVRTRKDALCIKNFPHRKF